MEHLVIFSLFLVMCLIFPLECKTRKPAVSGRWYSDDPIQLRKDVNAYLQKVDLESEHLALEPIGIVVPHAGFMFSGPVAAYCYKLLQDKKYDTVIMIGSSHHYRQGVVSVYDGDFLETPLGKIEVDRELLEYLQDADERIASLEKIHLPEHSNEAQLPFLQTVLSDFKAVSILTSTDDEEILEKTADVLFDYVNKSEKNYLFVISSDMSHFHPYKEANKMDKITLDLISAEKWDELNEKLVFGECELCGSNALAIFSKIYRKLGGGKPQVLKYANSGDAHPEYGLNEVVGYGAIVFPRQQESVECLTDADKNWLLKLARNTLTDSLTGKTTLFELPDSPILSEQRAVFVTLHKQGNLRGCIGYMVAQDMLYKSVIEMAKSAAFNDPRFEGVRENELADIEIEISVLTPMHKVNSVDDIVMGRDGVLVKQGYHSGVFLPQVARETGWDKETFLTQLCASKAFLPPDAWKNPATEIYIFQVEEFSE